MIRTEMDQKAREIFLEGLRRYKKRGVRILLDGEEVEESRWGEIFEVDGTSNSFYMGDYIFEDQPQQAYETMLVREAPAVYGRRLKEIRFDRVYNR